MEISRGDLVTVALPGDYGKPRPALIIRADAFAGLPSVTVLPLTGELHDWPLFRVTVEAEPHNGLEKRSQIMIDKAATVSRTRIGRRIGSADAATLRTVDATLAKFLGLG